MVTKEPKPITATERATKTRAELLKNHPFYGILAMHLEIIETDMLPTMGVDGKRLWINPEFAGTLNDAEFKGVIAHEVLHCVYAHSIRREERNPMIWNMAADFVINADLLADGFTLPDSRLFDPKYADMTTEQVYSELVSDPDSQPDSFADFGTVIDQQGEERDDGKMTENEKAQAESDWKERAVMAAMAEERQNASDMGGNASGDGRVPGTCSAASRRFLGVLRAPKESWADVLRQYVSQTSVTDYSWVRPNRRHVANGLYLPGRAETAVLHVVGIVDISGSISETLYAQFMAELQAMLDESVVTKLSVVFANTAVTETREAHPGDVIPTDICIGGGTAFSDSMRWVADNAADAAVAVYFTDMCTHDFGTDPGIPVMWAEYGGGGATPPFGEVVKFVQ